MSAPILLPHVLVRAPLLPASALDEPLPVLLARADVRAALAHGSRELGAAKDTPAARAARRRQLLRAAFRATPHGPWAGVGLATVGPRTQLTTGETSLYARPRFAALVEAGRAALDEPAWRARSQLRTAPTLVSTADAHRWLAAGDDAAAWHSATRDPLLDAVVAATAAWTAWPKVRGALARAARRLGEPTDDDALDGLLLELVGDGLLHTDFTPRLVGPPPAVALRARLAAVGGEGAAALVDGLPQDHVVLRHALDGATIDQAALDRAAALAPLLFRLQDALTPPAAERALDPELPTALAAITERFGAGALPARGLVAASHGVTLPDGELPPIAVPAVPPALLALLVRAIVAGLAAGGEVALDPDALDAVLPPRAPPGTFELMLAPSKPRRGAPAGTGWLLGLHAPAGATWGRFAEALGAPLASALAALARLEAHARPGEAALDVAFAPTAALADVAAHPPVRAAALALTHWPDGDAVPATTLDVVHDPAALAPLGLRHGARAVAPAPLARLRSTLAPRGLAQLCTGWSLWRQHAPWALELGALGALARTPRVTLAGFVVAPASWAIPDEVVAGRPGALRRWRAAHDVPRWIQLGHEDERLPVDLEAPWAKDELARLGDARPRAVEIWPPLGDEVDRGGRRVELVALAVTPESPIEAAAAAGVAQAGVVPAPEPVPGYRTVRIYGPADTAEQVLVSAVAPALQDAEAAGELAAWFFLRYADPRPHLRVRVSAASDAALRRMLRRLERRLAGARAAGDVTDVQIGDYHRELSRYGDLATMIEIEKLWQAESANALQVLTADLPDDLGPDLARLEAQVATIDALTRGLGLGEDARLALATRLRAAHGVPVGRRDPYAQVYRACQQRLARRLAGIDDELSSALVEFEGSIRRHVRLPDDVLHRVLPALVHLALNRMTELRGEQTDVVAITLWQRALDGSRARATRRSIHATT